MAAGPRAGGLLERVPPERIGVQIASDAHVSQLFPAHYGSHRGMGVRVSVQEQDGARISVERKFGNEPRFRLQAAVSA